MSSRNRPLCMPAAAIDDVWWNVPGSIALAKSIALRVPPTLSLRLVSASAVMWDMEDATTRTAELLHEAGETHHVVYRIVDGDDPDWASWYSDWLLRLSELPQILAETPVRSELTYMLVKLDRDYSDQAPEEPWP